MRNFTVFPHVTWLTTFTTFALPWLLALRYFITLTLVFPGTIHSFFAYENQGILFTNVPAHETIGILAEEAFAENWIYLITLTV